MIEIDQECAGIEVDASNFPWGPPVSPLFINTFILSERLRSSIEETNSSSIFRNVQYGQSDKNPGKQDIRENEDSG